MTDLDRGTRAYIAAVIVSGLVVIALATRLMMAHPDRSTAIYLIAFFVLTTAGEMFPLNITLGRSTGELTTSTTFAFAALLAMGWAVGVFVLCLGAVCADVLRRRDPVKVVFNAGQYAIAAVAAGGVLSATIGAAPIHGFLDVSTSQLPGIAASAATFYALNTLLVGVVIGAVEGLPLRRTLFTDFFAQAETSGLLLGLAPVLVIVARHHLPFLPMLFLPLLAIYRGERQALKSAHAAAHDSLTGLANRTRFAERVREAIVRCESGGGRCAVILLDLDHFKEVNDTLGHQHGDLLLTDVAGRLQDVLRDHDLVGRLGGDEFGVLLDRIADESQVRMVAARILDATRDPVDVNGVMIDVTASLGVAMYPEHGRTVEALLRCADIAMYQAKDERDAVELYRAEDDRHSRRKLRLAAELRQTIENGDLEVHFQPKVRTSDRRIVGAEALVRWHHPELGIVYPNEFLPLAEQGGLIAPLTVHVLGVAVEQASIWARAGMEVQTSVNLSPRTLLDSRVMARIPSFLERYELRPDLLELEITEGTLMSDPVRARSVLGRFAEVGVRVSIDDFGTGYSSLAQLRTLPVDALKIDRSFVTHIASRPEDAEIVRWVVDLGHHLDLVVIAEGVEDDAAFELLGDAGCDQVQGFLTGRPMPAHELTALLRGQASGGMPARVTPLRAIG